MPKRSDINSVLIIGSGPIVIGQACEFDYSGVQACKALKEEKIRVILINSNPATIMTDPEMADAIYIEPITWQIIEKIIDKEKPDAILPTMGGQTSLNCTLDLVANGILEKYGVILIGATAEAIDKAEDRELFRKCMKNIGLECPRAALAHSMQDAIKIQKGIGFPTIIRPSFTMGGSGGGIAYNIKEFEEICERGLAISPTNELLIEESVLHWKEFEMEVVRDKADNCIIVCAIENFDPMGVHTGDSITVAPAQTLTDKEYQMMRNASIAVLREIGVETGGSNVQFALNPKTGKLLVIEMNPRVSRSSALVSKATGFPIAKIATKLAIGYTLDELKNEITRGKTPASFEPTIDYVVTKIPRFTFEKFQDTEDILTPQMKSVGEVMAIGRSFQESLQKAIVGLETKKTGFEQIILETLNPVEQKHILRSKLHKPNSERLWYLGDALRCGWSVEDIYDSTGIDPWFLHQIAEIIKTEQQIMRIGLDNLKEFDLLQLKKMGFSDARIAKLIDTHESSIRKIRNAVGISPVYKRIDTCAAEFTTDTAYLYSTYGDESEVKPTSNKKMLILGGGPNRIGQGIEFDYCCVHAVQAMREEGYETIMLNCNPETVSTDYDTPDRLYFEPLTLEHVLAVNEAEKPEGVIVQFGGQTPLKLAKALETAGVNIIGTSSDAIDLCEDRKQFQELLNKLGLKQPSNRTATSRQEAEIKAEEIGYPMLIRPSYVLGGSGMEIVHDKEQLVKYIENAVKISDTAPVLLDSFLDDAIEVDVDAVCDGKETTIGGIMEHIEQAGIHSGDSASSLPPHSLSKEIIAEIVKHTKQLALEIGVIGLVNMQFAIQKNKITNENIIFILEVNPRAARTVPFISKSIGKPLAKIAAKCMLGKPLAEQNFTKEVTLNHYSVKESIFPFDRFQGVDPILGPEMKSTGEVMGIGKTFPEAFAKGLLSIKTALPTSGKAFLSVRNSDREKVVALSKQLITKGFTIAATSGTAKVLEGGNIQCETLMKISEGSPNVIDAIINGEIKFIVITLEDKIGIEDSYDIRRIALTQSICYTTTMSAAFAMIDAIKYRDCLNVYKLQELVQHNT